MSGWMYLLITAAVVYWVFRGGFRRLHAAKARGDMISYQAGSPERNWALALAHPTAYHAMQGGFACDLGGADEALAKQLRPMILHHLGLRTDLGEEQVRQQLPVPCASAGSRWICNACSAATSRAPPWLLPVHASPFVRCARLLDWIDEAAQWQVLMLNAQRAQQCFGSWLEFGQAYAQGRAQWVAQGRSDVLGKVVSTEEVATWVTEEQHPWHCMDWKLPLDETEVEHTNSASGTAAA